MICEIKNDIIHIYNYEAEAEIRCLLLESLSTLYMSCSSRMTEVSPTVSLKNTVSTVDALIIRNKGMARSSRPNLVG